MTGLDDDKKGSPALPNRLAWGAFMAATWLLTAMPRRMGLAFGAAVGGLVFRFWRRRREVALANMKMIQEAGGLDADLDTAAAAKRVFENLGRSGWEDLYMLHRGIASLEGLVTIEDGEFLADALKRARGSGKGVLMVTGHSGNWELSCHVLAYRYKFKLHVVGRRQGSILADTLITRLRSRDGGAFIFKDGGARAMLSVLRHGGAIGTLIDQAAVANQEGTPLDFMGRPAMTNLGPLRLARRTGSEVVMCLLRREGERHFIEFRPPFTVPAEGGEAPLLAAAQRLNDELAAFVRRYPDQWLWGHRRWKTPESLARDEKSFF